MQVVPRQRINAVLVCYYPAYRERAIAEFRRILALLPADARLIVVATGSETFAPPADDVTVWHVPGSEFSAWDHANRQLGDDDAVRVFANDTFCHHRPWNAWVRAAFIRRFHRLLTEPDRPQVAGHVDCPELSYQILDCTGQGWISTYLFAFSRGARRAYGQVFALTPEERAQIVHEVSASGIVWGPGASAALAASIDAWLFPGRNGRGWYLSGTVGPARLAAKLDCILAERLLSARLLQLGIVRLDARAAFLVRVGSRWWHRIRSALRQ